MNTFSDETELENEQRIEYDAEVTVRNVHMDSTLNLLLYTFLLILTVLTIFMIKKRRYSFVNETGLTLIYGLIVGLIMKFVGGSGKCSTLMVVETENDNQSYKTYPDVLRLTTKSSSNLSQILEYRFDLFGNVDTFFDEKMTFDSEFFFGILLPPIIFNAGYSLKKRSFFRNIGTILTFSIFGTTISCIIIGLIMFGISLALNLSFLLTDLLLFGATISATDPVSVLAIFNGLDVDVDLFAILFGESTLNDAVAIVLYGTIEQFAISAETGLVTVSFVSIIKSIGLFFGIFFGSLAFGIVAGFVAALVTKFTKISDYPLLETSFFVCTSYLSFLLAEVVGMTGVVALLFCGICQAHYTYNNLSKESKSMTKDFFEILNFLSVSFIFAYVGVSMFTSSAHYFNLWFILGSFVAIFVARAFFVYLLSAILNIRRNPKIPFNYQHMLLFSGLRGAVAFALSVRNTSSPHRRIIYTTTSLVVIFTVLINGSLTKKIIQWLRLKFNNDQEVEMQSDRFENSPSYLDDENCDENANIHSHNPWDKAFLPRQWYNVDAKFFKPLLTNCQPNLMETMPQCCSKAAKFFTSKRQMDEYFRRQRSILGDVDDCLGDDLSNSSDETQPHFGPLRFNSGT